MADAPQTAPAEEPSSAPPCELEELRGYIWRLEQKLLATVRALLQGGNLHAAGEDQLRELHGIEKAPKAEG